MSEKRLFSEKVGIQEKKSDLGLFSENVRILNFWEKPKNSKTEKYEVLLLFKISFFLFWGNIHPIFLRCSNCLPYFHKAVLTGFFAEVDF